MPTRSPQRDAAATRERLVRAALDLYTTHGFLRTTTVMLAERAGIAEGTIYRHFPGKEELLNEVYRLAHRWALDLVRGFEGDRARGAQERLAVLGRQFVDRAGQDPALVRMVVAREFSPFLDAESRALRDQVVDGLVRIVAAGKGDGRIRTGPAELWVAVWLEIVGFAAERVADGGWEASGTPTELTLAAAWDAISAP